MFLEQTSPALFNIFKHACHYLMPFFFNFYNYERLFTNSISPSFATTLLALVWSVQVSIATLSLLVVL